MQFTVRPMTHRAANAIAGWRYEPPFDVYDLDADPEDHAAFFETDRWGDELFAVYDADTEDLVGFYEFERADEGLVELGLGLRPDRTGAGHGEAFVETALDFARETFDPDRFRLGVAAFNERARTVYERVGFTETDRYVQATNGREFEFVRMEKPA